MKYTKQDIQDATSDYLVNTPTPDTNILDTTDDTIDYIKEFLQPRHYYTEPTTTPTSHFYSPTNQYHLTPDLRADSRNTTTATATETSSLPNASSPTNSLSNSTEEPSNFLSTHPPGKPREDNASITNDTPSDSPRFESSPFT